MKLKSLPKVALLRVKREEGSSCCRPYEKILQWKAEGMKTLLQNAAMRLALSPHTKGGIDKILQELNK